MPEYCGGTGLTITDELARKLVVFLHQAQVQCRAITHLVISVIQASGEKNVNTTLDLGILLANAELRQRCHCRGTHDRILQDNAVVDIADVLGRLSGSRTLNTEQVENTHCKLSELAVFDELAEVCESLLLGFRHELDQIEDALHNTTLEVVSTLVAQDPRQESKHASLFRRELQAKCADGLHNRDLELVGDVGHEGADLLHESVDAGLVASLEEGSDGESGNRTVGVGDEAFNVRVALADSIGLERGELVQDTDGGELGDSPWRGKEEL